jgi:hypothetical protein
MNYIFEVFPVHPRPQPLEALTSYLSRLAAANGIRSCGGLLRCVFPNYTRYAYHMTDFPLKNWDALPQVAALTVAELQAMTFYSVGQNLGCSTFLSYRHLLKGCIASHFRYCPHCLKEQGYAPLTWRFTLLAGCTRHNIYLHDTCPHCEQPLPLLQTGELSLCPLCGGDLCQPSSSQPLSPEMARLTRVRTADLTSLLQSPTMDTVGWQPAREAAGVTLAEMARSLRCSRRRILVMEWGQGTLSLPDILLYCDRMGLCVRDVLAPETVSSQERDDIRSVTTESQAMMEKQAAQDEADLLQQVQAVADQLLKEGLSVTVTALSQRAGIASSDFNNYPTLRAWLQTVRQQRDAQRVQSREAELLERLEAVVDALNLEDETFRMEDIYRTLGMSGTNLQAYPRVAQRLDELVVESLRRRQRDRDELWAALNDAIERLSARGETVTREGLQQEGLSLVQLSRYAVTKRRLAGIPRKLLPTPDPEPIRDDAQAREQAIYRRVREVLTQEVKRPIQLTLSAVARAAGVSPDVIRHRPALLAEVQAAIVQTPYFPTYSPDEVITMVLDAAADLHQRGISPTQPAVCHHLGWAPAYLVAHPEVRTGCQAALKTYRDQQRQQHSDDLLAQVEQYLAAHPDIVSGAQVARALNHRWEQLAQDKRVYTRIEHAIRQKKVEDAQQLWQQTQAVVASWQAQGIPVTQQALVKHLKVAVERLNDHAAISTLLVEIRLKENQQWQQYLADLTDRARQYVQQQQAAGGLVTQEMMAAHLGMNVSTLDAYPGIRVIYDDLKVQRLLEKTQREDELAEQVEDAIRELNQAGVPVNQKSIAAHLGWSPKGLKYYPRVRARLQEVIQSNQMT